VNTITRRTFLASALSISGTALATRFPSSVTDILCHGDASLLLIEEVIGPIGSIIEIGHATADFNPGLPASDWSKVFTSRLLAINPATKPGIAQMMKNQYRDKISRDFENEQTTMIDGWLMSKTEAEVCLTLTGVLRKAACIS
jgi:hypothetical protein